MKNLKGSQTEINLMRIIARESQDRNRYSFFASKAKKEGYVHISLVFEETANHEKAQAKRLMKFLEGGEVDFHVSLSAEGIGTTLENLKAAAANENEEQGTLYPDYARQARVEGFEPVALVLEAIIEAEKYHEKRYRTLALNLEAGRVFKRAEAVWWRCQNCGYVALGEEAPVACAACAHPQAHFEILVEER